MSKLATKKGFTVIESVLAITILIIGLFAVINFFPLSTKIIGNSQDATTATSLALAQIETINTIDYENLTVGTYETKQRLAADSTSYLYNFQRQTIIDTVDENFDSSAIDVGLKRITVTVYWQSAIGGIERSISIDNIKSDF